MPSGPPTILIVDDEYAALQVLELLLRGEGFDVVSASDGLEALTRMATREVDLVITDYKMPGMDGLELCARMKNDPKLGKIPVFLSSATYGVKKNLPDGVVAFIPKPIQFPLLLDQIRSALDGSSQ